MKEEEILDFVPSEVAKKRPEWHPLIDFIHIIVMKVMPIFFIPFVMFLAFSRGIVFVILLFSSILFATIAYFSSRNKESTTLIYRIIFTLGISIGIVFCLGLSFMVLTELVYSFDEEIILSPLTPEAFIAFHLSIVMSLLTAITFGIIEFHYLWKKMPIDGTSDLY